MKKATIDVIVIGTGGLAREFTNFFTSSCNILGYSTMVPNDLTKFNLKGRLFPPSFSSTNNLPTKNLVLAIGSPKLKKSLYKKLSDIGFMFPSITHETAFISESASLGEGVVISPLTIVGPNTQIGKLVYCNYHVGIGHDSKIGDYTQINPGAQIGGEVFIHSDSIIGSNSTLLNKTSLNKPITVGSGSVILGSRNKTGTIAPNYSNYLPF